MQPELHDDVERGYGARAECDAGDRDEARQLGRKLLGTVDVQGRRRAWENRRGCVRAGDVPADGGRHRSRLRAELAARDRLPPAVLLARPVLRGDATHARSGERVALQTVERRVPWEGHLLRSDDERCERSGRVRADVALGAALDREKGWEPMSRGEPIRNVDALIEFVRSAVTDRAPTSTRPRTHP